MGLREKFGFAKVLSFVQLALGADVQVNPGGGANLTGKHVAPAGDDSQPLAGDFAGVVPGTSEGSINVVGYVDAINASQALPGEKRQYSRDADGVIKAISWLRNDGQIFMTNANGTITVAVDGTITLANADGTVTLGSDGSVTSMNANGSVTLAATGSVTSTNANGSMTLLANGTINLNGLTIDTSGNLVTAGEVTADSVALSSHDHDFDYIGDGSGAPAESGTTDGPN